MKNVIYKFQITPITPFHIGNGEVHDPLNLIIKSNRAYFINQLEYVRYLIKHDKAELNSVLRRSDLKELHKYFTAAFNEDNNDCHYFSYAVRPEITANYQNKIENLKSEGFVRSFIRSQLNLQPYIPGSSLKGAIRTAILSHYQKSVPNFNPRYADSADRDNQATILGYWDSTKHRPEIPSDPFKFLKFADTPWSNDWLGIFEIGVVNPPVQNINRNNPYKNPLPAGARVKRDDALPVLMEIALSKLDRQLDSKLSISITDPHNIGLQKLFPKGHDNLTPMLEMIKEYYRVQLDKEVDVYNRLGETATKNYGIIKKMQAKLADNECMIKLGMGSGQNYCSYAVMNHNPKTRKLINHLPLGWMKLSFEI